MIQRQISSHLKGLLKRFPAVGLIGPRQCGKTTLARTFGGTYFDMEQAADRVALDLQWDQLTKQKTIIILDEAQTWPELFPRLRGTIDANRKMNGCFLLLGSIAPSLMRQVSESLAGRLALCELTPLLLHELSAAHADELWLFGGYPEGGILDSTHFSQWQHDYLTLLAQRDLPEWGLPSTPQTTQRFFSMLAAVHGRNWNASSIGKSLGVNYHTANSYLDYLEQAFLVRRLPSYSKNLKKRIVKSPKMYWRDSGVLHSLLGVKDFEHLLSQPWVGHSWEGWVIEQILSAFSSHGIFLEPYYLRIQEDREIDLVFEYNDTRWAVEVKLTANPDVEDMNRLRSTAAFIHADQCVLISRTQKTVEGRNAISTNVKTFLSQYISL